MFARVGYNTLVGVILAAVHTLIWIWWIYKENKTYKDKILASILITWLAAMFELGDFPPIAGLIDAHALWHLGTVRINNDLSRFACCLYFIDQNVVEN